MDSEELSLNKVGASVLQKFANEEIMTKSELDKKLDAVMNKYVDHMDRKFASLQADIDHRFKQVDFRFEQVNQRFDQVDKRFGGIDVRYNWIISLIITATIGVISIIIKIH